MEENISYHSILRHLPLLSNNELKKLNEVSYSLVIQREHIQIQEGRVLSKEEERKLLAT